MVSLSYMMLRIMKAMKMSGSGLKRLRDMHLRASIDYWLVTRVTLQIKDK